MGQFKARSALQTGVELIRRRPLLVLLWAALLLAETIIFALASQEFTGWIRASVFAGRAAASFTGLGLVYALARLVLSLMVTAILWASAFRAILRPAARNSIGFGGEELLLLGAWLVPQLVLLVVAAPLTFLVLHSHAPSISWLVASGPAVIIDVLALFWGAVAAVWAFERLQVAPLRCWRIARGRFWLLAGLVVGVAVFQRLAAAEVQALSLALSHRFPGNPPPLLNPLLPHPADLAGVFRPPALLRDVLGAVIKALEIAFVAGIVASAYSAGAPEPEAASFSAGSTASPS